MGAGKNESAVTGSDREMVITRLIAALKKAGKVSSPKNCYYEPAK